MSIYLSKHDLRNLKTSNQLVSFEIQNTANQHAPLKRMLQVETFWSPSPQKYMIAIHLTVHTKILLKSAFSFGGRGLLVGILVIYLGVNYCRGQQFPWNQQIKPRGGKFQYGGIKSRCPLVFDIF